MCSSDLDLVAQWMLLGFVHGVMNTDNMALSGEGIDYGPCAVLDVHRRGAVFSSIDRGGRYAYGNQPGIALWNLSRFAEALLPVIEGEPNAAVTRATTVLEGFESRYLDAYADGLAAKLGVRGERGEVRELGEELFTLLEEQRVDHTGFFQELGGGTAAGLFAEPAPFEDWSRCWEALRGDGDSADEARAAMRRANPLYVPRNVHLEAALRAAHLGDMAPVLRMLDAVGSPFERREGLEDLEGPGDGGDAFMTFCGT